MNEKDNFVFTDEEEGEREQRGRGHVYLLPAGALGTGGSGFENYLNFIWILDLDFGIRIWNVGSKFGMWCPNLEFGIQILNSGSKF